MTTTKTSTVSFRVSTELYSWVQHAGQQFRSEGDMVRLILLKAVADQSSRSGLMGLFRDLLDSPFHTSVGSAVVITIRLTPSQIDSIRYLAVMKGKNVSEWCGAAIFVWGNDYASHWTEPGWVMQHVNHLSSIR